MTSESVRFFHPDLGGTAGTLGTKSGGTSGGLGKASAFLGTQAASNLSDLGDSLVGARI